MSPTELEFSEQDAVLRAKIDRSLRHPVMFFFTSGAAWLAVALILGIVASIKSHAPEFLDCIPGFTTGRIKAAHMEAFLYGWCAQAAFGVMIWLMARLSRQPSRNSGMILAAGHVWNLIVGIGVAWILIADFIPFFAIVGESSAGASGKEWMQMPSACYPAMLICYLVIGIGTFINFRTRRGGHVYISQWYILAAMFWFPWILATAHIFVNVYDVEGAGLGAAAVNAWYRSSSLYLFLTPIAAASAYYLAPKITGRPVYSYSLGLLGFWILAVVAPWSGLEKIFGAPYASFIQHAGAAATVLILAPAIAVGVNILMTIRGHMTTVMGSPSLLFTSMGIFGLLVTGVLGALLSLPVTMPYTNFTLARYGYEMMALYGFFSMCMFGAIYFIVPRITGREWVFTKFIKIHFFFSLYGILFVAFWCVLLGGFMQGLTVEDVNEGSYAIANKAYAYNWTITIGWAFVAVANVCFCFHLLLMWMRLGRRSAHPTLLQDHHDSHNSPHGPEGDLEQLKA